MSLRIHPTMAGARRGEGDRGGPLGLFSGEVGLRRDLEEAEEVPPAGGSSRTASDGVQSCAREAGLVIFQKSALPRAAVGTLASLTTTDFPSVSRPVTMHRYVWLIAAAFRFSVQE
jgi:hypothetical protein